MPQPWTAKQKAIYRKELSNLYLARNLTIGEISILLGIKQGTVYDRLIRLGIRVDKNKKIHAFNRRRLPISIKKDESLAEIVGILLGDGHLSNGQVWVTLGTKEKVYADYVDELFFKIFGYHLKSCFRKDGNLDLYIGFKDLVNYFKDMGLVEHKVRSQVGVPLWVLGNKKFYAPCLRGLFDTDGSIYKIRSGHQISFRNMSVPLLKNIRYMLLRISFNPSQISNFSVYLTRRGDLYRFRSIIGSRNPFKHKRLQRWAVGGVVKHTTL